MLLRIAVCLCVVLGVCGGVLGAPTGVPSVTGVWGSVSFTNVQSVYVVDDVFDGNAQTVTCVVSECGWSTGTITVSPEGDVMAVLDDGTTKTGQLQHGVIYWSDFTHWNMYDGALTGLWTGTFFGQPPLDDTYVVTHTASNDSWAVYCLGTLGPCSWSTGTGTLEAKSNAVALTLGFKLLKGTFNPANHTIVWGNDSMWTMPAQELPKPVHSVHVVFSWHLDVGYNGINPTVGFVNNVLNKYFDVYFPHAVQLANDMRALGGTDRYIMLTHPWLVSMYLDCPQHLVLAGIQLHCPSPAAVANFTAAIKRGDVTWHAGPFNMQPENMSPQLFKDSIGVAHDLDAQFNLQPKITLSQRDVPFMTRGVVPLLNDVGVTAITVGTNVACQYPDVPKLFVWEDPLSGEDVIALEHPHGYGGITQKDCARTRGGVALCYSFRTDNSGPPAGVDEVITDLDTVRKEFPDASVFASTYDNFINAAMPEKDTFTRVNAEIGDTWIYGVPSDSLKQAEYRAAVRVRDACLASGACSMDDPVMKNMTRFLIKPAEHTWGLPAGGDRSAWSNVAFHNIRNLTECTNPEASWIEQRRFTGLAIEALEVGNNTALAAAIRDELALLTPSKPSTTGLEPVSSTTTSMHFPASQVSVALSPSMALTSLYDSLSNRHWATPGNPVGLLVYQSLNDTDYDFFASHYMESQMCEGGFCKFGSNPFTTASRVSPTLRSVWRTPSNTTGPDTLLAYGTMSVTAHEAQGAPQDVWVNITFVRAQSDPVADGPQPSGLQLHIELQWFNKTSTRLPESITYNFMPAAAAPAVQPSNWTMDKLGSAINPEEVMLGGSPHQHAVWSGVTFHTSDAAMTIESSDVAVVLPVVTGDGAGSQAGGQPLPAPVQPLLPNSVRGMAFNAQNNLWDTNYVLWYPFESSADANSRFRFTVKM